MRKHYQIALDEYNALQDSLSNVMHKGVLDLPMQTKELYRAYADAIARGDNQAAKRLEGQMDQLAKGGAQFTRYFYEIESSAVKMRKFNEALHILEAEALGEIPFQFVIDWAIPTDKKVRPRIMTLGIVSTLSALFFTLVLMLVYNFFHSIIKPSQSEE